MSGFPGGMSWYLDLDARVEQEAQVPSPLPSILVNRKP